jgi:predicted DNA-binding transcriptional regulator YafY
MKENIYMFGGESKNIILRIKKVFLDEFIDWFKPEDVSILEIRNDHIIVSVKSNVMAMKRWALRYALYVRILAPLDLVEDIKKDIDVIVENYK